MRLSPRYDDTPVLRVDDALLSATVVDPAAAMVRQRQRLARALAELDADQWSAPSRCDGWSVQDVIAHLIGTNRFWALSIAAGLRGEPTRFLAGFDPVATPAAMVADVRLTPWPETLEQFVASNDELATLVKEVDAGSWGVLAEAPPGHVPLSSVLLHALWDAWIHERDILLHLGSAPPEDAEEIAGSLLYSAALSPALLAAHGSTRRGALEVRARQPDVRFVVDAGPSVRVHAGDAPVDAVVLAGDAVGLVEALSFRAPLDVTVAEADQWLLDGLATAFDRIG